MLDNISHNDKLTLKAACEKDFRTFIYFIHKVVEGCEYRFYTFLCPLIDKLQAIADYQTAQNLVINMPPGWGKSRLFKYFLAWTLIKNPNICHLYTSYSDSLIQSCSDDVKKTIESDFVKNLWGYKIRKDKSNKHNWAIDGTTQSSGMTAASMDGTITGVNGGNPAIKDNFCGAIVIDDPQKPQQMVYASYRKRIVDTYNKTLKNRKRRNDVPIILIMQRLDPDDLTGWILQNETDWDVINVPALVDGQSQNPDNITTQELISLREKRPAEFYAQYQQQPKADIIYTFSGINYADDLDRFHNGICLLDKGFDGSDSTAFCTIKEHDGLLYVYGKLWIGAHYIDKLSEIYAARDKVLCGTIFTEKNDDKNTASRNYAGIQGYHEKENKHRKIMTYLYAEWSSIRWHPDTDEDFIEECRRYNEFAKDDHAPDCLASAIRQIKKQVVMPTMRPF
ncbi:MAG: hypothetical protein LBK53_09410 [Heliobacteriaceae bacterium]|jgi:hypothetical protein|nr:hypothetical protein [Heliobacteriaceae bacterium]